MKMLMLIFLEDLLHGTHLCEPRETISDGLCSQKCKYVACSIHEILTKNDIQIKDLCAVIIKDKVKALIIICASTENSFVDRLMVTPFRQ